MKQLKRVVFAGLAFIFTFACITDGQDSIENSNIVLKNGEVDFKDAFREMWESESNEYFIKTISNAIEKLNLEGDVSFSSSEEFERWLEENIHTTDFSSYEEAMNAFAISATLFSEMLKDNELFFTAVGINTEEGQRLYAGFLADYHSENQLILDEWMADGSIIFYDARTNCEGMSTALNGASMVFGFISFFPPAGAVAGPISFGLAVAGAIASAAGC